MCSTANLRQKLASSGGCLSNIMSATTDAAAAAVAATVVAASGGCNGRCHGSHLPTAVCDGV